MDRSVEHSDHALRRIADDVVARFDSLDTARDLAVTQGRQVIRLAASAVRALHRAEHDEATALLVRARTLLGEIRATTTPHPSVYWAGYVQDAMKEFAEAAMTAAILRGESVPTPESLGVEDAAWLNALAEAASELRRDTLDALRANEIERAEYLLDVMDAIYVLLVTIDFPDAVTGGLRRTTDQLRAVLERTRGDVAVAVRQHRLERALQAVEQRFGS